MSATNARPAYDAVIQDIADYVLGPPQASPLALETAHHTLLDALGCALAALDEPAACRLMGPLVPGTVVPHGARVPGTALQLDPVQAAFDIGLLIRWLDFNDTWLAAEWGHPSDNLGAILALADWLGRSAAAAGRAPPTMRAVLHAIVQAHEIQGVLALENAFNRVGLDHVLLVKVASTAVACRLLGLARDATLAALSNAWLDGQSLRTYRQAPNTGSRKSWAAGDAASRGVRLALLARSGEMGYPSAVTAPTWGFCDASYRGQPLRVARRYGCYVIENVLFKVSFPAEFHGQTAVEAALALRPRIAAASRRLDDVASVTIRTQQACLRIIDRQGPLTNPAARDHCIQYMVAVALLRGRLCAADYGDAAAADPRIDALRARIHCVEDPQFTRDYHDPEKRSIANGLTLRFRDGTALPEQVVEYPLGHPRRRAEGIPLLLAKFRAHLAQRFPAGQQESILAASLDLDALAAMPAHEYLGLYGA